MKQATKELARLLPDRIRLLARLLGRKPSQFTPAWAKTIDEAFVFYTRTSTINGMLATMSSLAHRGWAYPAFIDFEEESRRSAGSYKRLVEGLLDWKPEAINIRETGFTFIPVRANFIALDDEELATTLCDAAMIQVFGEYREAVFEKWLSSNLLAGKQQIVREIQTTYALQLWAATITAAVPLLDHVTRQLFGTFRLNVTIQILRDAFEQAGLKPKDLQPGSAIWDAATNPSAGNTFAKSLEEDLRLPGILLSSFVEFAGKYYEWYVPSDTPINPLNRHAIMHCASEYWTHANAVRIVVFIDLMLRLERVLKLLIHGVDPGPTGS